MRLRTELHRPLPMGSRTKLTTSRSSLDSHPSLRLCSPPAEMSLDQELPMAGRIAARLAELKIELPKAAAPVANYVPVVITGNQAFVSGQVTVWNGEFKYVGQLGKEISVEDGQKAARICGHNIVAQLQAAQIGRAHV